MNRLQVDTGSRIDASAARGTAANAKFQVDQLTARVDQAMLVCEALWTLLRDRLNIPEEELIARVNEIDLLDGKLDGKVTRGALVCPTCQRTVARRHRQCIYCGHAFEKELFS
jgi:hypothetical protein